jgi:hypothetical protein
MRKVEKNEGEEKEGLRKRTWIRRRIIYRLRKKRELVKRKKIWSEDVEKETVGNYRKLCECKTGRQNETV